MFIPVDKADPNKLIYTELLSVRPEDKTSEVSIDGGDFSSVDADGVYTKRVVLTNKTFDANNDGTPDTFIVPMKVKSQSGDIKEYKIYVTVSDLDLGLTSVKVNSTVIKPDSKGNYVAYVDNGAVSADVLLQATENALPEIRSLDGNIVAPNGGSNLLVVRGFDISKLDPNNPDGLKFNIRLKAKDSAYERIVPLIFKAKSGSTKITVEVNGRKAVWNTATNTFEGYLSYEEKQANIQAVAEDDFAKVGIETNPPVDVKVTSKLINVDGDSAVVKIYVTAQNGTPATVNGKGWYTLNLTRRSGDNGILKIFETTTNVPAMEKQDPVTGDKVYSFYFGDDNKDFGLTVVPASKATLRVGYYDKAGAWIGSDWTSQHDSTFAGNINADENKGKYSVEVRAENGDIKAYSLNMLRKKGDVSLKSIVTNRGEVSHFNVKMDKDIQYDAYVPEKNVKIEIRPNDENAKILSVRRVVAPNDDAEYTDVLKAAEWDNDTAPDGTRNFILKGGVKLGTVEYYRIEIESHSGVIGKRYLLLRGMSDDISVHRVKVNNVLGTDVINEGKEYIFKVDNSLNKLPVEFVANSRAYITYVNGVKVTVPAGDWNNNGEDYKLSIGEQTAIGFRVDLCRSEERRVGKECRSRWSPYH